MMRPLLLALSLSFGSVVLLWMATPSASLALVDPEEAEDPNVMQGFRVMLQTTQYAADYAGDTISCNNCHFDGGNSFGGRNNGIPLVGVAQAYPRYSEREDRSIDLTERINNCFRRSLNGRALPPDAPQMKHLLAYFEWISTPVAALKQQPWLGLPPIDSHHKGDRVSGRTLYLEHCAGCHHQDGKGNPEKRIPPVWGDSSFNDGAGMNKPSVFAAFIYLNMPHRDPYLTEEQSLDIAAYVTSQPRPHFE